MKQIPSKNDDSKRGLIMKKFGYAKKKCIQYNGWICIGDPIMKTIKSLVQQFSLFKLCAYTSNQIEHWATQSDFSRLWMTYNKSNRKHWALVLSKELNRLDSFDKISIDWVPRICWRIQIIPIEIYDIVDKI